MNFTCRAPVIISQLAAAGVNRGMIEARWPHTAETSVPRALNVSGQMVLYEDLMGGKLVLSCKSGEE